MTLTWRAISTMNAHHFSSLGCHREASNHSDHQITCRTCQ
jgi:hypothetical protein